MENIFMIDKPTTLENLLSNQSSLAEKKDVPARVDAATILANLTDAGEVVEAQASLEALKTAVASGNKEELAKMLGAHSVLLDALSIRLLSDAHACKSSKLTITILELALKSFDATRKTVLATNELITSSAPVIAVAVQVNA